jgi:Zn-dependent protease with chaperone function
MNGIRGFYYNGRNATRQEIMISREGDDLFVRGENLDARHPAATVRISPPLGSLKRTLRFPDGSTCEVAATADLSVVLGLKEERLAGILGSWERSLPLAIGALLLTALLVVGLVKYGIPFLARQVAYAIPPATERILGRDTLGLLDRMIFSPSRLPEARRKEIEALFRSMTSDLPDRRIYRLEFRSGNRIGANAFALPSGIIVVTDGLEKLASSNDELLGVLAHETAHVRKRHALRQVLQNSASTLVIALITGDVLSITSFSATLPTFLIDASYSRDFEREADDEAVAFLDRRGISRKNYADMLTRLRTSQDRHKGEPARNAREEGASPADWFSTHPDTAERVRRILEKQPGLK